jgi:tetratricopeptide (TPR) repeat protein
LPATAAEVPYLRAVLGLEKAEKWPQAAQCYQAAVQKWPTSFAAHMGVGNAHYAMGDLQAAEHAFTLAAARFPNEGAAYNNLAQVLYEQGKIEAALIAAEQAVRMGGPLSNTYQETLQEIERFSK